MSTAISFLVMQSKAENVPQLFQQVTLVISDIMTVSIEG